MIVVTVTSRVAVLQRECLTGAGGYEAAFLIAEKVAVAVACSCWKDIFRKSLCFQPVTTLTIQRPAIESNRIH